MNVLFITLGNDTIPSTRTRVFAYLGFLEKRGIAAQVTDLSGLPAVSKPRALAGLLQAIPHFDVVYVQKRLFPLAVLWLIRVRSRRLVYDFDDALFVSSPGLRVGAMTTAIWRQRLRLALRVADCIVVGNDYLRQFATRHNPRVVVLPTAVDTDWLKPPCRSSNLSPCVVIGWIGTSSSLAYLAHIGPALHEVGHRYGEKVLLRVVCDRPYHQEGIAIENKQWRLEEEPEDLGAFDIGVMPLLDDPRSRGKCGYKLLQYMAKGIPVVCSPVGANKEIVTDGVEGYWADSPSEWFSRLSLLIEDHQRRVDMGRNGRATVCTRYSRAVQAPRLVALLKEVATIKE